MLPASDMQLVYVYLLNVQVIPAFEEAVSGMALGGIRRCCIYIARNI